MTEAKHATEWVIARAIAGLIALPVLAYAIWYGAFLFTGGISKNFILLPIPLCALTLGSLLLWIALGGASPAQRRRLGFALLGGFTVGGIAFIAGFVGPLLLRPSSNQGPLLGFIITGPLGFVVGCIGGALLFDRLSRSTKRHG